MIDHLYGRFKKFEKNWTINAVILSGMGERAFCAGGDIKALYEQGKNEATRHLVSHENVSLFCIFLITLFHARGKTFFDESTS